MERNAAEARGGVRKGSVPWEPQTQQQPATPVERLNPTVQDQSNLQAVREHAISLHTIISRLLENLNSLAGANADPKWQDLMRQVPMVHLEFFRILEDVKKVSNLVIYPRNVTCATAAILPGVLSPKVLPEIEKEENSMRKEIFQGMEHLPVSAQIERLKTRIDMIGEACESAEKVIAEGRKDLFRTKGHTTILPTIDLVKAALIKQEEEVIRRAVTHGEGLRRSRDDIQNRSSFPAHIQDALHVNECQSEAISKSNGVNTETYLLSSANRDSPGTSLKIKGRHQGIVQHWEFVSFHGTQLQPISMMRAGWNGERLALPRKSVESFLSAANSPLFNAAEFNSTSQIVPTTHV